MLVTAASSPLPRRRPVTSLAALAALTMLATGACGPDPSDVPTAVATTAVTTTIDAIPDDATTDDVTTDDSAPVTTDEPSTTTTEAKLPIPPDALVVVPQQNREDPAKGRFQLQVVNGTDERFAVTSVQFVWAGYTTPVTPKDSQIVAGQTIDLPVPFPGATCVGDGSIDDMPSLDSAIVRLGLDDGSIREVPVIDRWHLARKLYLDDCRRQTLAAAVTIEWADLREVDFEGRPVTEGVLRLTRLASTSEIRVERVSGTIPYTFRAIDTAIDETVVVLAPSDDVAEARVRFVEGRCDPHALAEVKQPHQFVAQVDLGDGELVPFVVVPDEADWIPMRLTADTACIETGQVVFVGEEADA